MLTKYTRFYSSVSGLLPVITILAFTMFLYGCSPTVLLYDDFKSDPLGGIPTKDIPGSPTGDLVQYASNVGQRLKVVSFTAVSSGKGLEFNSKQLVDGLYGNNYLNFRGIPTGNFSKQIRCSLVGKFDNFRDELLVSISDGAGLEFARFNFHADGMLLVAASQADQASGKGQVLCKLKPDVSYFFNFTVDMKKKSLYVGILGDVTVDGQSKSNVNVKTTLINNPLENVTGPITPTIAFQWAETAGNQSKFVMTGLEIRQW